MKQRLQSPSCSCCLQKVLLIFYRRWEANWFQVWEELALLQSQNDRCIMKCFVLNQKQQRDQLLSRVCYSIIMVDWSWESSVSESDHVRNSNWLLIRHDSV